MLIFVYRTNINKLRRRGKRDKWRPKIIMKRQHGGIVYSLHHLVQFNASTIQLSCHPPQRGIKPISTEHLGPNSHCNFATSSCPYNPTTELDPFCFYLFL
jgi:hypothetical protein